MEEAHVSVPPQPRDKDLHESLLFIFLAFWLSWNKYTIIGERACKLHNWAEIELEPRNTCFEANVDLFSYLKISCVLLYMWKQIYTWKQR